MSPVFASALLGLTLLAPAIGQPAQPAAAGQPLGGPQVAGVCLLSQQAVFTNAKVGIAATQRLKQLAAQSQAGLDAERTSLQADAKALEGQRASLKAADYQTKAQALQLRAQSLQQRIQTSANQIELTRQKALGQIATAAQPVIAGVYKQRGCGLLLDRNAALGGNMAGDLTAAVVQGLDAKMTTISFDLAPLPAQPAAGS